MSQRCAICAVPVHASLATLGLWSAPAMAQDGTGSQTNWWPLGLAGVLALALVVCIRMVSQLKAERQSLLDELASAKAEADRLDERMKRSSEQLATVSGDLVKLDLTDRMTQLGNRRRFDDALNTEFHRLRRSGKPLSLVVMELDHLQNFIGTQGPAAADRLQREVGGLIKKRISRVSDVPCRLGDGEFALVLPDTDYEGAKVVADQIRQAVERLGVAHPASSAAKVATVSVGVCTVTTKQFQAPGEVLDLALGAVDRARDAGRNRVAGIQRVQLENA